MFANVPDAAILWVFNGLITALMALGGWYVTRQEADIKAAKDTADAAKLDLLAYKIEALKHFSSAANADKDRAEILTKLTYLTGRIDALLEKAK